MPKFRKKPVVIEAVQWMGPSDDLLIAEFASFWFDPVSHRITTPEGSMAIVPDDWIIKGVKGEFYPCRDDIFRMTYEAVE